MSYHPTKIRIGNQDCEPAVVKLRYDALLDFFEVLEDRFPLEEPK